MMKAGEIIRVTTEHRYLFYPIADIRLTCKTWADIANIKRVDRKNDNWIDHFRAGASEVEVANKLGLIPTILLALKGDGGKGDLKCGQINIGVKATIHQNGHLALHEPFMDHIMFLCIVDPEAWWVEIRGWTTESRFMKYRKWKALDPKKPPQWCMEQKDLYSVDLFQHEFGIPKCHNCGVPVRMNYMDQFCHYTMTPTSIFEGVSDARPVHMSNGVLQSGIR